MNSIVNPGNSAPRLDGVTADELTAVSGGDNNMLMDWSKNTGVVFEVGGRIAIWVEGKKTYVPRS